LKCGALNSVTVHLSISYIYDLAGSPVVVLRSGHDGTSVDILRSEKGSPFKKDRK
jgi:hypothetical protein